MFAGESEDYVTYLEDRIELAEQLIDHLCLTLDVNPDAPSDSLTEAGVECYRKWFGVDEEEDGD